MMSAARSAAAGSSGLGGRAVPLDEPLCRRQAEFADAILDPDRPVPSGLIGPGGRPGGRRFGIYRNNVILGLCETVAAAFPAVRRLVGAAFFTAMAKAHARREPPASTVLLAHGGTLPDFIDTFEPAGELSYLSSVARIERACVEAYHAEEAAPLAPPAVAGFAADRLARARLKLHPSLRIVRSTFPALSIWRTNVEDETPSPVNAASGGEDAIILRPAAEVAARLAPPGGAAFLASLASGVPLAMAAQAAAEDDERCDLAGALTGLVAAGAVVAILTGHDGDGDVEP